MRRTADFAAERRFSSMTVSSSSADFIELGRCFGVSEAEVRRMLALFPARQAAVERAVTESLLSDEAKVRYLSLFRDRLRAIAQ